MKGMAWAPRHRPTVLLSEDAAQVARCSRVSSTLLSTILSRDPMNISKTTNMDVTFSAQRITIRGV